MTKEQAIKGAQTEAQKYGGGVQIAVVHDPIANAEDESGPWGYCPVEAVAILFPYGTAYGEAICNGEYNEYPTPTPPARSL